MPHLCRRPHWFLIITINIPDFKDHFLIIVHSKLFMVDDLMNFKLTAFCKLFSTVLLPASESAAILILLHWSHLFLSFLFNILKIFFVFDLLQSWPSYCLSECYDWLWCFYWNTTIYVFKIHYILLKMNLTTGVQDYISVSFGPNINWRVRTI